MKYNLSNLKSRFKAFSKSIKSRLKSRLKPKTQSVSLNIIVYMALKNLWFKKLRTTLTITGVIIGIGSIYMLLSFGLGLQKLVEQQITDSELIKSVDVVTPNSDIIRLNEENLSRIEGLPGVEFGTFSYTFAGITEFDEATSDSVVYGADEEYIDLSGFNLVAGRTINYQTDQDTEIQEAIVSTGLLNSMGLTNHEESLDKSMDLTVPLQGQGNVEEVVITSHIVGVIDSGQSSEIFVSKDYFENAGVEDYSQAKIMTTDTDEVPQVRQQIESQGFETISPIDTLEQVGRVFHFFNLSLLAFGTIGMIIAILGMFNTLTISLLERTKEIGLMVATGGRHRDMRRLFIAEALLLSLAGGVLGIIGATGLSLVIDLLFNSMARGRGVTESFSLFAAPFWLIAVTLLFVTVVGLLVAYLPAKRAAKINPIDALRYE